MNSHFSNLTRLCWGHIILLEATSSRCEILTEIETLYAYVVFDGIQLTGSVKYTP